MEKGGQRSKEIWAPRGRYHRYISLKLGEDLFICLFIYLLAYLLIFYSAFQLVSTPFSPPSLSCPYSPSVPTPQFTPPQFQFKKG